VTSCRHSSNQGVVQEVQDVRFTAGVEVVDTDHLVTIVKQTVDQMRTKKARATRNDDTASV
jgi:hypothetical protein